MEEKKGTPGRKKTQIDWVYAEKLAKIQCTEEEMASFFGCTIKTFAVRLKEATGLSFPEWFKFYSANGKISLRRAQYRVAVKGSIPMLIWLGKQYLGQSDKIEEFKEENPFQTPDSLKADDDHKEESEASASLQ